MLKIIGARMPNFVKSQGITDTELDQRISKCVQRTIFSLLTTTYRGDVSDERLLGPLGPFLP